MYTLQLCTYTVQFCMCKLLVTIFQKGLNSILRFPLSRLSFLFFFKFSGSSIIGVANTYGFSGLACKKSTQKPQKQVVWIFLSSMQKKHVETTKTSQALFAKKGWCVCIHNNYALTQCNFVCVNYSSPYFKKGLTRFYGFHSLASCFYLFLNSWGRA